MHYQSFHRTQTQAIYLSRIPSCKQFFYMNPDFSFLLVTNKKQTQPNLPHFSLSYPSLANKVPHKLTPLILMFIKTVPNESKISNYLCDGTGRDTYINNFNGGIQKENQYQLNRPESGTFTRENRYASPAPRINSKINRYRTDGTGRDGYIRYEYRKVVLMKEDFKHLLADPEISQKHLEAIKYLRNKRFPGCVHKLQLLLNDYIIPKLQKTPINLYENYLVFIIKNEHIQRIKQFNFQMSDSFSVEEVSGPTRGRLKRVSSSEEENKQDFIDPPDSIDVSEQSEVEQVVKPKSRKPRQVDPTKPRKAKLNKVSENAANQIDAQTEKQKQPKKKKIIETNDQTVENLLSKKFIQASDEEEPPRRSMDVEEIDNNRDTFGMEAKQPRQKCQKAKNINQLIKNRHRFFTQFEDAPEEDIQQEFFEEIDGQELKFEKNTIEPSAFKQKAKREMLAKCEQYKQSVFGEKDDQLKLTKTSSLIIEEQPIQQKTFKRTYSMGMKKGLTQQDLDDPEIQLYIPKINGAKDQIFENTLFLNKIKQKGLDRVVHTSTSLNNSNKAYSRSEFNLLLQQKQVESRASKINLTLDQLMNRFQSTSFEQIDAKREQEKKQNDEGDDDSSPDEDFVPKQDELNQESEDIDDASSQGKLIDNKAKEDSMPEKMIEQKEQAKIKDDIIIEEQSDQMSEIAQEEKQQLEEINQNQSEDSDSSEKEELKEESLQAEEVRNEGRLQQIISSENDEEDAEEEDFQMFKRLKKVSQMFRERKQKEKELEEKKKQKLERIKEREKMRKFIESNLVENQAEQGSDNESHDDVVKEIHDEDEENENEVIEKELLEMIDDKIEDLNEENEEKAFQIFMDRMHAQEKEDIKKILKGEFKRRNGKVSRIDLLNLEQTEEEKQARLMHKYESSAEENYDSDFENYMKMNKDQKNEFLKEKRLQKILQAQQEMNQQTKRNRLQEQQLFQPELIKRIEEAKKQNQQKLMTKQNSRPPTFKQSFLENKKVNENSNFENSNSVSLLPGKVDRKKAGQAINKLFQANLGTKGQQLQKSPNKGVFFIKKK